MDTWETCIYLCAKAQENRLEKGTTMTNINLTEAIRSGILTFEQALALQGMAAEVSKAVPGEEIQKPKGAPAPKKPKVEAPKAEEPKAEEPKAYAYTKGGAIIQYADNHTLKANNLRRVNNAMDKLVKAGFCASWKRIGGWVYLYHSKDGKTRADFEAVKLAKGWEFSKKHNAWIDKEMLKDYADNFKA